jgi:hypothetical protein
MAKGLWRDGHWVCVTDEDRDPVTISRTLYELRGLQPPFDELPTKDRYVLAALRSASEQGGDQ